MTSFPLQPRTERGQRRLAWAAPVAVAAAVAVALAVSNATASEAAPELPGRTPAQLIAAVLSSDLHALSGTVRETANLGLPSLPGGQDGASLGWQTFITGSHSARVWVDGAAKQRIALLGELSEADVVHNGHDVWTYTSDTNTVTHSTVGDSAHTGGSASPPAANDLTPAGAAARALKAIGPSTSVTVDGSSTVADRPAYTLVLRPKDVQSTVQKVTIAVDAKKLVPLRVQVYGSSSAPAFETGFTSISFGTPAASVFDFHAPAGATTGKDPFGTTTHRGQHRSKPAPAGTAPAQPAVHPAAPKVIGSDWTSVLELAAGTNGLSGALGGSTLHELTSPVGASGMRLLHTALVNAVLLPDGRVFVGAVQPALLEHLAATH